MKRDLAVGVNLWLNDSLAQVVELARSVKDAELDFVKALNANDTSVVAVIHCRVSSYKHCVKVFTRCRQVETALVKPPQPTEWVY